MTCINSFSCYNIDMNKEKDYNNDIEKLKEQDKIIIENSDTFKMTEEHNYSILENDKNDNYSNIDGTDRVFSKMKCIAKYQ